MYVVLKLNTSHVDKFKWELCSQLLLPREQQLQCFSVTFLVALVFFSFIQHDGCFESLLYRFYFVFFFVKVFLFYLNFKVCLFVCFARYLVKSNDCKIIVLVDIIFENLPCFKFSLEHLIILLSLNLFSVLIMFDWFV